MGQKKDYIQQTNQKIPAFNRMFSLHQYITPFLYLSSSFAISYLTTAGYI